MRLMLYLICFIIGCASNLPDKKPEVKTYNPDQISFLDLETSQYIPLSSYMKDNQKDWLLLYFHSRTCTSCVEKMKTIRDEITPDTFKNSHFEIVGVSADPDSSLDLVKRFKEHNQFNFVKWLDSRGDKLKEFFLNGAALGVPFTALVTKNEILWSYQNTEHYSLPELVTRIKQTVPEEGTSDPFYFYNGNSKGLTIYLAEAEYTIINVFGEMCISCIEELKRWSEAGQGISICQKPKCQFLNLENGTPEDEPTAEHYTRIQKLLIKDGLNVSLILDPHLAAGDEWKKRYFDGYLTDHFPNWGGVFGSVVYHRGEIVKDFKAGSPDEVTTYIQSL